MRNRNLREVPPQNDYVFMLPISLSIMKASLRSVRIAPKKASLVAKMIRGLKLQDAFLLLERTNKKAARLLEDLLKSAQANAKNNENQDSEHLVIRSLIVNKAQAYHRGIPMARGRMRRIRKFMSHVTVVLGVAEAGEVKSVKKKLKDKSFAAQVDREQIKMCKELLGMELDDFIQLTLDAMKGIAGEIGL